MALLLTTTGAAPTVQIDDLGARTFSHPTTNFNLMTEFSEDELQRSADLQAHVVATNITLTDGDGNLITTLGDAGPHKHFANNLSNFDTEVQNNPDVAANTTHRGRTDNPHAVSHTQAGAAPTVHTHVAGDVTDFDTEVQNNPAVAANTTHRGRTDNPHTVTQAQIGLGNVTDDAQLKRAANDFSTFPAKGLPVVNDLLLIEDSQDTGNKKHIVIDDIPYLRGVDNDKVFYVGKHGNDANDGKTLEKAVLTFGRAIVLVNAQTPASGNTWCIRCEDSGQYTENLAFPTWTFVDAPTAILIGNHNVQDYTVLNFGIFRASAGTCINKSVGTSHTLVRWDRMVLTGAATGVLCTAGGFQVDGQILEITNGLGIIFTSMQEIYGKIGHIEISGGGIGIGTITAGTVLSMQIDCIHGSGTALYADNGSVLNVEIQSLDSTGTAYIVAPGGELNLFTTKLTGTETNNGILNLTKAGCVGGWSASSLGVSSTTSTTYQQKLRLSLTNLVAGTYTVSWHGQIQHSDTITAQRVRAQIELDNTTVLSEAQNNWDFPHTFSGVWVGSLGAGNHTFDVDYSAVSAGTASISQVHIFAQRVR